MNKIVLKSVMALVAMFAFALNSNATAPTGGEPDELEPTTPTITLDEDATKIQTGIIDAACDVTVKRTMTAGKWNTLCLPFGMSEDEINANFGVGAKVMEMVNITADGLVEFETTTEIKACYMYIVDPVDNVTEIEAVGKTGIGSAQRNMMNLFIEMESYCYVVIANANKLEVTSDIYDNFCAYILSNNKFYEIDSDMTIKGFRWIIQDMYNSPAAQAKKLTLSLDGEVTAISEIAEGSKVKGASYNLVGQRVNADAKGIVIVNGKKYFNK